MAWSRVVPQQSQQCFYIIGAVWFETTRIFPHCLGIKIMCYIIYCWRMNGTCGMTDLWIPFNQ